MQSKFDQRITTSIGILLMVGLMSWYELTDYLPSNTILFFTILFFLGFSFVLVQKRRAAILEGNKTKDINEQLEYLVRERTQKLQNEIEEHIRTEGKLRKLSRAVEKSPASVVITDHRGTIEYVNPKFTELTQYTEDEAIGQNPSMLNSGKHTREFYKDMWTTILTGKQWLGEFCNKKKNGEIFWEKAAIAPIKNDQGKFTHFVAVKEDITAQKSMLRELRQAKESADQANEAKSLFLSSMSHELRTPLNTILGFAQLLDSDKKQPLLPMQQHGISQILSAGEHLLQLISEILDLTKIESGTLKMSMEPTNIHRAIYDVVTMMSPMAKKQEVSIHINDLQDKAELSSLSAQTDKRARETSRLMHPKGISCGAPLRR